MPFMGLKDGLYLVEQKAIFKGNNILHYGVLDIGNILGHPEYRSDNPIIIHQTPPEIRADYLSSTGNWLPKGIVKDEDLEVATSRIQEALKNPAYDLFGNNCEHFARYVIEGDKRSYQVIYAVGGIIALGILAWTIAKCLKH